MRKQSLRLPNAMAATLAFAFLLLIASCAAKGTHTVPSAPAASAPVSSADSEAVNQGGEYAFFAVIDRLWQEDTGLNSDIKYLSLDLTGIGDGEARALTELLEDFCTEHALTLLTMGYDKLVEDGYITDLYFADGILFAFEDAQLTDTVLTVTARKWRSGLGAIGGDFTVTKHGGVWSVEKTENNWIS